MNENDIYPEDPTEAAVDLDDVEGHGLKEVAAGLGAAAVLAGGAAGASQLVNSASVGVHPSGSAPGVTVSVDRPVDNPISTINSTTDSAISGVQSTRDAALRQAGTDVGSASSHVQTTGAAVDRGVDATLTAVQPTVHATKAWATQVKGAADGLATAETHAVTGTAHTTKGTVDTKADHATSAAATTATTTATTAVDGNRTSAASTVRAVDRKAATILSVVTTTAADGVHTAKVTLKAADAGAGMDASSGTGWVLVKAGDTVLAQVHMTNGTATCSWTMPLVGGHGVTISYTGDSTFAPSARSIVL